jgi:hypothetical protein
MFLPNLPNSKFPCANRPGADKTATVIRKIVSDKPRGNVSAGALHTVTLIAETQMKFARTYIALAAIRRNCV